MRYTLRLATCFGIPLKVHFTFPLVLILFGIEGWVHGGWRDAVRGVFFVLFGLAGVVYTELVMLPLIAILWAAIASMRWNASCRTL